MLTYKKVVASKQMRKILILAFHLLFGQGSLLCFREIMQQFYELLKQYFSSNKYKYLQHGWDMKLECYLEEQHFIN